MAISLKDGKRLWSRSFPHQQNFTLDAYVGNLNGDKDREVIVTQEVSLDDDVALEVKAFDGHDGKDLWTWNSGAEWRSNRPWPLSAVLNLGGAGSRRVCVNFKDKGGVRRVVVLDEHGKESARRDLPGDYNSILKAIDLDGDRRDEILVVYGDGLHAWRHDLTDFWSWPGKFTSLDKLVPASPGRRGEVIIHPGLALDGKTGQAVWAGQRPLVYWPRQFQPNLLDRGDSTLRPLWIGDGLGATVCRVGLPAFGQGTIARPRGAVVLPGVPRDDPRWTRAFPWLAWLKGPVGPWGFLAACGLAFVNVVLPLVIVRPAAGRRQFSVRALMALPVAAAVPLMVFLMLEPVLPVGPSAWLSSEKRLFVSGTVAGVPMVLAAVLAAWCLAHGRLRPLAALAGLTIVASVVIAGVWLWLDMKSMPSIERFGWRGWYLVALPGVYAGSVLLLFGWAILVMFRLVKRHRAVRSGVEIHE